MSRMPLGVEKNARKKNMRGQALLFDWIDSLA
jgi:hypothetical protein